MAQRPGFLKHRPRLLEISIHVDAFGDVVVDCDACVEQHAARLAEFETEEDLHAIFGGGIPDRWSVLSGGNNILFTQDYDGLLLTPVSQRIALLGEEGGTVHVRADAGADCRTRTSAPKRIPRSASRSISFWSSFMRATVAGEFGPSSVKVRMRFVPFIISDLRSAC